MTPSILTIAASSAMAAVAASTLATTTPASDQKVIEADGHRSIQVERPQKKPASRLPLSMHFGVDFIPIPVFSLAPIDHWSLMLEDEQNLEHSNIPLRYGVQRDLLVFEEDGQWVDVPTGRLWRVEIQSQGAENARLGLAGMDLPEGAEVRLYMADHLEMIAGPFTDDGPMDNGEVWSFTMPGDSVIVEYLETGKRAGDFGIPFAINELTHGYRPILRDGLAGGGAGNCHNHPACYAEWSDLADAAALVFSGGYVCSGQLIATTSGDETPYYTTANHCIGSAGQASSAEFRFRYERTTCSGSYSNGNAVNGSTLVAEWPASDNTLLRINGSLPSYAYFAGWTTADPPSGTDSTCLHYPQGDYIRISFGDANSNPVCGSNTNWVGVGWYDAVTEPGSSGSAIYRDSDQKLYGVLTCGSSSCGNQSGLDGYGRFSRAYENAYSGYLGGSSDDSYEPNDSCSAAIAMTNATYSNMVVMSTSEDWFRMEIAPGATHEVVLDFAHANGDIDGTLYSACGGSVLASGESNTNDENISWTNDSADTVTAYMRVFLYSGTFNEYNMSINDDGGGGGGGGGECPSGFTADCLGTCFPDQVYIDWQGDGFCDDGSYIPYDYGYTDAPEGVAIYMNCDEFDCDSGDCTGCDGGGGGGGGGSTCEDPTVIGVGDHSFDTTGSSDVLDLAGYCDMGEWGDEALYSVIFFEFTAAESATVEVSTCNQATFDTRLSVHADDCEPSSVITCLDDTDGCDGFTTTVSFSASEGQKYLIAVGGYSSGDAGTGTLSVSSDGGGGGGGGGECPSGFTEDCLGTCFPDQVYIDWQGDGYCDDGSYIPYDYGYTDAPEGVAIYMNCDEFDCDSGDCTGCDGGGGGGGECEPSAVALGDNNVDTSGSVGVTLDLTGYCDPGEFGTDAFLNTAFFSFTAPGNGLYTISTCNQTAWDTRLSVHGGDCEPSSVIACLDDTEDCDAFTTILEFDATAGTYYVIALGGYGATDYGPAVLTIDGDDGGGGGGGDPTGACCVGDACYSVTAAQCTLDGGTYLGDDSTCAADSCDTDDCVADLNGSGTVDGADLTLLLGAWNTIGGDLNGSGNTDGADLTIMLGYWGDC